MQNPFAMPQGQNMGGMPGMPGMPQGFNMNQAMEMMNNPMMQQMMSQMLDDPVAFRQYFNNPMIKQ